MAGGRLDPDLGAPGVFHDPQLPDAGRLVAHDDGQPGICPPFLDGGADFPENPLRNQLGRVGHDPCPGKFTKHIKWDAVEGDWLVLGDMSGSMEACIVGARRVAATLAAMAAGDVHLVFFNAGARNYSVTGKDYDQVLQETRRVTAGGGTSIGIGVNYARQHGWNVDGIAVVSDAQENTAPMFADEYQAIMKELGKEIPMYLYRYPCGRGHYLDVDLAVSMKVARLDFQEFDMSKADHYALANLVKTMRSNRFALSDEILATPLLTIDQAFEKAA